MHLDFSEFGWLIVGIFQGFAVLALLLRAEGRPSATLAWLLAVLLIPIGGLLAYLLFGTERMVKRSRRAMAIKVELKRVFERHGITRKMGVQFEHLDYRSRAMLRLGEATSGSPPSFGNVARMLVNGAASYRAMFGEIDAATDHVHVEFYIIQPDRWGRALRDRLVERASAGVHVRLLVDAVGSYGLPAGFFDELMQAGGQFAVFKPLNRLNRLRRRERIDFRNHRKIMVIDGRVAFTGGMNIGKEYLGLNPDLGHWRDSHVQLKGPAALSLQATFAEDWLTATGEMLDDARFYPEPETFGKECVVQIVDSGPDHSWSPIQHYYFQAITMATERVWITSPYFIPDSPIEQALVAAALRGVDVRVLLPLKSDVRLVSWASRSYYPLLHMAGIQIYEYARGFIHAKTLVVDDWLGTIGSANLDMRSFYLNFEVNAFIYDSAFASEMADQFNADLRDARQVDPDREVGVLARFARSIARLLSPLL